MHCGLHNYVSWGGTRDGAACDWVAVCLWTEFWMDLPVVCQRWYLAMAMASFWSNMLTNANCCMCICRQVTGLCCFLRYFLELCECRVVINRDWLDVLCLLQYLSELWVSGCYKQRVTRLCCVCYSIFQNCECQVVINREWLVCVVSVTVPSRTVWRSMWSTLRVVSVRWGTCMPLHPRSQLLHSKYIHITAHLYLAQTKISLKFDVLQRPWNSARYVSTCFSFNTA